MAVNRGKKFEEVIRDSFRKVPHTSVIRLHDQTTGFAGSTNICDFIVYHYPNMWCIECKTIHGNTFPLSNISDNQWNGLLEQSHIGGVKAGVIIWWVDKDVTKFFPIQMLQEMKLNGAKSVRYDVVASNGYYPIELKGKKKRVFFDYELDKFL